MDYKIFLQSLSWDEFQTYRAREASKVKLQSLSWDEFQTYRKSKGKWQSLSWDEFQTCKSKKVNQDNLTDEQKEILRVEDSRRAIEYARILTFVNKHMLNQPIKEIK